MARALFVVAVGLVAFSSCQRTTVPKDPAGASEVSSLGQACGGGGEVPRLCTAPEACDPETLTCIECGEGRTGCNQRCTDTISFLSDAKNCGTCGVSCAPGGRFICNQGSCGCAEGLTECNVVLPGGSTNICVDTLTDKTACGACGVACPGTAECVNGQCVASVCEGLKYCDCGVWVASGATCPAVTCNTCAEASGTYCGCGACVFGGECAASAPAECPSRACPGSLTTCTAPAAGVPQRTSLFGQEAIGKPASDDTSPIEVGVRFRSTKAGVIKRIRFYREVAIPAGYTATLWSESGTPLATGRVIEGQCGSRCWNVVEFAGVAIDADTTYVASYFALSGQYNFESERFAAPVQNGPLSAPIGAGVFRYGAGGGFPNQVFANSNYGVDVVFESTAAGVGTVKVESGYSCPGPLTATFAAPSPARLYAEPADIEVGVGTRVESGRSISKVEVTANGALVCSLTTAPYKCLLSQQPGGTYELVATVFDSNGAQTSTQPLPIRVRKAVLGSRTLGTVFDSLPEGTAEAFAAVATESVRLGQIRAWIDGPPRGEPILLGVYSDAGDGPGQLLTQGTAFAVGGQWANVFLNGKPSIQAGQRYWLALLHPVSSQLPPSTIKFRTAPGGLAPSVTSIQRSLTALPQTWTTGERFSDTGLGSIFATP
jgi:Domain of unknown function (DUF4082)